MLDLWPFTVALAAIFAAAILFVWRGRRSRQLIAKIPSPPSLPFFGVLFEMWPFEEFMPKMQKWASQLGPVVYVPLPIVSLVTVTGPDEIQTMLLNQENIKKGLSYTFLKEWLGTGLLTGSGDKWRYRRRMITPAFNYKILEEFVPVFNENSAILVENMRKHLQNEYVEIDDLVTLCTLDIICETVMGTSVNAQKGEGVQYIRAVKRMLELFIYRACTPLFLLDFFWKLSPTGREEKAVLKVLQDFSDKVIKEKRSEHERRKSKPEDHMSEPKKKMSFLSLLLEMSDEGKGLTDEDIREEANTFMFAGHDTTAAAICWALYLIGSHQDVQDKIISELSDIFGSDDRLPTPSDLSNMTYLDMAIKEALRLYPSVASFVRTLETDIKLGDYVIPSGMNVVVSSYIVHRNPDIYPDPEKFKPERFSPENTSGRHSFAYIPFSGGPRNCIGQKFARLEEKCVISTVLRNFKLVSVDEEVILMPDVVLKPKTPIKIKLSARL